MSEQANGETILQTGELVGGQYRVHSLIAKGGMAAVWVAVSEHTGKRVALKVILQSFARNSDAIELFRREALTASKVNHPSVVDIFDVIDHKGMTCIVMELLEGETLGHYLLDHAPLSLETTLALLLPAMGGVAAVNAQGVVHRDLKPGNIFLCCGSDGGILATKVLDFGISVMARHAGDTAPVTELASMLGTPAYMAPEAIQFSPTIDGRADVYGFGVLWFEALTGKLPFIGPPGMDLLGRILTEPAPPVTLYRPDLPSDVVNLIACALAKDPKDRFADMDHFIRAAEDRLLPLLPFPRSLTPIAGSAVNEAPTILPLAKTPLPTSIATSIATSFVPTKRPHASRAGSGHFPKRRLAIGAALAAFLLATAWVSLPGPSSVEVLSQRPVSRPPRTLAATPTLAVPRAPAPAASIPMPTLVVTLVVTPHESPHVSRDRRPRNQPSMAGQPQLRQPPSGQPSSPRAGRLSPSDF